MLSRVRVRAVVRRRGTLSLTVAVLVFAGMAASGLVNVWIEAPPPGALPGVALGSQTLLVAERAVAFFAIWLLVLVVAGQALAGRLPVEISGRGVRYADAETTQAGLSGTKQTLLDVEAEMVALRSEVLRLAESVGSRHE